MYSKSQVGLKAHGLREANSELLYELQVALMLVFFSQACFFLLGKQNKTFHRKLNPGFGFSDFKQGIGSSQKMLADI